MALPLPGNSTKEQSFYDPQAQPAMPGMEYPGTFELAGAPEAGLDGTSMPAPSPFKLNGGR